MITASDLILAVFVCVALTIGVIGTAGGVFKGSDMEGENTTKTMVIAYKNLEGTLTEMKDTFGDTDVSSIGVVNIVFGLASGGWTAIKMTFEVPTNIKILSEGMGNTSAFLADVLGSEINEEEGATSSRGVNFIDIIYYAAMLVIIFIVAAAVFNIFA